MAKFLSLTLLGFSLSAGLSVSALAHPQTTDTPNAAEAKAKTDAEAHTDLNAYFEQHAKRLADALAADALNGDGANTDSRPDNRVDGRIDIINDPEALREAARDLQNMLADSGMVESLADSIIALADDIEITDTGDGMSFGFDGKTLGMIEKKGDDAVSFEAFGKSTIIEKETTIENGKKRTRIIIETDAENDVDYEIVPKAKNPHDKTSPIENGF